MTCIFWWINLIIFVLTYMFKSAVHHFWNLGRKWLNMLSTDTCTCIHQHYFSRVIVGILFCLFVWRRMKPVDEYINSMATKFCTTVWTHQISAVKTAFMNSSTATAQMLRPVKETSQLKGSGEGIILAHTSKNIQQESMVSPVQQL